MLTVVLSDIRTCASLTHSLKTRTSPGSRLAVMMSVTVAVARGELGVIQCLGVRSRTAEFGRVACPHCIDHHDLRCLWLNNDSPSIEKSTNPTFEFAHGWFEYHRNPHLAITSMTGTYRLECRRPTRTFHRCGFSCMMFQLHTKA